MVEVIYRFGDFELDSVRCELRQHGTCADVQPKVLRLLLHLVEHRDRVVGNDELLRVLWPEATVGRGSIKRAILGARQALGEQGEDTTRIRTVRGFGYQFVGDVAVQEVGNVTPSRPRDLLVLPARSHVREALLGREGVMDLLQESLQQALAGACRCVLITGGPGLGKTRAVEELLADAQQLGADAWFGRCTEVEGAPAFWPFIQVLRAALRDRGATELRALLGSEGADIAGAISELRDLWPDLPEAAPLSSTSARFRLFDSMSVFLQRAASKRPIVMAIDDLHRADPASLRLLCFMLRQLQRERILILGALRPDPPESLETAQLLEELKSASRCVALQGLSPRDIARYVELSIGVEPPASVSELLHAQTAGNPLFMQHLIENWRAAGRTNPPLWQNLASAPQSLGLSGAIERHLELVSPACRELLRAAAVLGTEFSAGTLSRVTEQNATDTSTHLAEATASGLMREVSSELGRHRFAHVLVRDALYAQLSAAERIGLHRRAGCVIEAQGVSDNPELLAEVTRHFVQAAPSYDAARALEYTLRAAESALRTLAYEQAATYFAGALELLQYLPPDPRQRMRLLFRRGDALARVDMAAARAALFEAAGLARDLADSDILVRAAALLASRPESGSVDAAQVEVLRQALAMLRAENEEDDRCVSLQALIAKSLLYDRAPEERVSLASAALIQARRLRTSAERADALTRCHEALPGPEHLQERLGIATELVNLAHQSGDTVALLSALTAQIETCVERGDMEGVDAAIEGMDVLAERLREPYYRWNCKVVRAMRDFVRGDLASSDRRVHEAWRSGAPISAELARHIYCVQNNALLRMRGRMQETEPLVREMMVYYPNMPGWSASWGALVWDLGQHDNARRCFSRVMERGAVHTRSGAFGLGNCAAVSELCCKVGDVTAAKELYAALVPFAGYHSHTTLGASTYGPLSRHLGALAETAGDAALADTHYRAALTESARMRSPVYISGVSYWYARMLLRAGDTRRRARVAELLSNALELADQSQLQSIAAVCRGLAERHGVGLERLASAARKT
jgi:DNA-binding winged helix-turn-helix (wHTH) protein